MRRLAPVLALSALLAVARPTQAADLSPARWPAAQRADLQARELGFSPKAAREVRGSVLITGTASPVAIHAGIEALRNGGSASDAATVVALTQIARTMGATVSYAGKMTVAYYDAGTRKVSFLDAGWSPYAGERDVASIPDLGAKPASDTLGRQTLVPGFMRGVEALHARFGRLPWADLFEPAIWSADNGVERSPGGLIRQPELSRTLRAVAGHGADEMYRGAWARDYVEAVRAHGGHAALGDLAAYRPRWRAPISTSVGDATVLGPSGSYLACSTLTALSLLDAMPVRAMGPYWKDPAAFRAYARAIQYATLRQVMPGGPTALERKAGLPAADCPDRLAKPYAATLATELLKAEPQPFGDTSVAASPAGHHTMAVVVVDAKGDVAVLVHSTNGGLTGIVVDGVPIPEAASVNKWALPGARPGDLLANDIAPLIALRRGRPIAAVGGTGTSLMPETVRLMGGALFGHESLAAVTAAPPLLYNFQPPKTLDGFASWPVLAPAKAYDPAFQAALAALGVSIKEEPRSAAWTSLRGTAAAAVIDPTTGKARAVEVPVIDMFAEAER